MPAPRADRRAVDLTVAGIRLEFRARDEGLALAPPAFEYPPFLAPAPARRRVRVDVTRAPAPARDDLDTRFDTGDGWRLLARGCERRIEMPDRARGGPATWTVDWNAPLAHAVLYAGTADDGVARYLVQYPLDQILLTDALLDDGALLLHAAGGSGPGAGVAFAGRSGAGKSTVARLLAGVDGFRLASDDRVAVRCGAGGASVHGTPWAGDAGIARADGCPLGAIFFLRQAGAGSLRRLPPAQALERLLPVATLPWYDRERLDAGLRACERLARTVTCFELSFGLDRDDLVRALGRWRDAA